MARSAVVGRVSTYAAGAAACLLIIFSLRGAAGASFTEDIITNEYLQNKSFCMLSLQAPAKPRGRPSFCPQYASQSCCLPETDGELADYYSSMTSLGTGCTFPTDNPYFEYAALRDFWCISCDTNMARYTTFTPAPGESDSNYNVTFRLCQSLADQLWNYNGAANGTQYNQCGLMQAQLPCFAGLFACGSNLVIPSQTYTDIYDFIQQVALPPVSPFADPNTFWEIVPDGPNCYAGSLLSGSGGAGLWQATAAVGTAAAAAAATAAMGLAAMVL